jgi:hypothetical protein
MSRVTGILALLLGMTAIVLQAMPSLTNTVFVAGDIEPGNGELYRLGLSEELPPGDHHDESGTWIKCSTLVLLEDGVALGPGHSLHAQIEVQGGGQFSHWQDYLNFSSSDGTDPRSNGRTYTLMFPATWAGTARMSAWSSAGVVLALWLLMGGRAARLARVLRTVLFWRPAARVVSVTGGLCLALLVGELALRVAGPPKVARASSKPSNQSVNLEWLGNVMRPGSTHEYDGQNGRPVEFHTKEPVNAFGFLDVEHTREKPAGTRRVLVLGDSYVQAAEVPTQQKWTRRLEGRLAEQLEAPVEVVALGRNGAGVSAEYGFWRGLGRDLDADLVLLLMTPDNDFVDDSLTLQAVKRGFDPEHPPRYSFRLEQDELADVPPALDSSAHQRSASPTQLQEGWAWLNERSSLAGRSSTVLARKSALGRRLFFQRAWQASTAEERAMISDPFEPSEWLRVDPALWPSWLLEAREVTRQVLRRLEHEATTEREIPFLVCLGTSRAALLDEDDEHHGQFVLDADRPRRSVREMLEAEGLGYLDLTPGFRERGEAPTAHYVHDGHWNARGHEWVAQDVAAAIVARGLLP